MNTASKCLAHMIGYWDPEFEPIEHRRDCGLLMMYGDSLSSLSLVSVYSWGISLFSLAHGGHVHFAFKCIFAII